MKTLALVGVGKWGMRVLESAKLLHGCTISYLCSPHIFEKRLEGSYTKVTSYQELLSQNNIDGVIIATPTETHYEIASQFLSNGFSVLVEKPLTTSLKEVKKLHMLAQKNNCVLRTDYIYLQNLAFQAIQKHIKNVGDLRYLEFAMGNKERGFQGDGLWEWAPHVLSMGLSLLQREPRGVTCNNFNDIIFFTIAFPDNIFLTAKIGNYFPEDERLLKIVGKNGYIIYNEKAKKKLSLIQNNSRITEPRFGTTPALVQQLREFCKALDTKKNNDKVIDLEITKLIECLEKSQKRGGAYQKYD